MDKVQEVKGIFYPTFLSKFFRKTPAFCLSTQKSIKIFNLFGGGAVFTALLDSVGPDLFFCRMPDIRPNYLACLAGFCRISGLFLYDNRISGGIIRHCRISGPTLVLDLYACFLLRGFSTSNFYPSFFLPCDFDKKS